MRGVQQLQLTHAGSRLLLRRWLSRRTLGQPTAHSHPGLLRAGEILPGIDQSEFSQRRVKFMEELSKSHTGMTHPRHLAVVPAAPLKYRYSNIPYQFHQNPDFLYLTGFMEPNAVLLLVSDETRGLPHHRSILYVQPRHTKRELWDGPRTGPEDAVDFLGVDEAYSIDDLEAHLLSQYAPRHYAVWHYSTRVVNAALQTMVATALGKQQESKIKAVHNLVPYLDAVRVIKSHGEMELLRGACRIAGHAFRATMAGSRPGMWEYQLESLMEHAARMRGAWSLSFPPVVAGGARGNHIHYIRNDHQLKDGELVLVDAGADYHGYVSDITRTWPVNGCFTSPQRDLYSALLEVQEAAVRNCKPGISLNYLHLQTTLEIGRMLKVLEIASPRATDESLFKLADTLFPTHVGHYLGMETHDTQSVSFSLQLLPGMVVTVEPGVYLPTDLTSHLLGPKAEHFKGMAIRIEDDVLLTDAGNEVLSAGCPKSVDEIEALVGTAPSS